MQVAEDAEINETNATMYARPGIVQARVGDRARPSSAAFVDTKFVNQVQSSKSKFNKSAKHANVRQGFNTYSNNSSASGSERKCFRCNDSSHMANKCRFNYTATGPSGTDMAVKAGGLHGISFLI